MKFWKYGEAKAFIEYCRRRGFLQIRFPGGTSWNGDINSVILIAFFDSNGKLYFLVIPYNLNPNLKYEETKELGKKENPKILAVRKLREETGLKASYYDLEPLLKVIVSDNRLNHKNKNHIKYFYLLQKINGELIDRDNEIFNSLETSTPFLAPGPLVAKMLFGKHLDAYEIAIKKLSGNMDKEDLYANNKALEKRKKITLRPYKNKKNKTKLITGL